MVGFEISNNMAYTQVPLWWKGCLFCRNCYLRLMLIVKQLINSIISMQHISGYERYIMIGLHFAVTVWRYMCVVCIAVYV